MAHQPTPEPSRLGRWEGEALCTATEAFLKGLFETETRVSYLVGPSLPPFDGFAPSAKDRGVADLLHKHEIRIDTVPDAARGITCALQVVRGGGGVCAWIPRAHLASCIPMIQQAAAEALPPGSSFCLLIEEHGGWDDIVTPMGIAQSCDMPTLVVTDIDHLRRSASAAFSLSRASGRTIAMHVHESLLCSAETIHMGPNRVIESASGMLARRRMRTRRIPDSEDVLRSIRRLELNRTSAMPSPGERVELGFVTVGVADATLRHVLHRVDLSGRFPMLNLGVVFPVDPAALSRFLARCEQVIVLEPGAGAVEKIILGIAQEMHRAPGEGKGKRSLPCPVIMGASAIHLRDGDVTHPSRLAQKLVPFLQAWVPGVTPGNDLQTGPAPSPVSLPSRMEVMGISATLDHVRKLCRQADEEIGMMTTDQQGEVLEPCCLAIDMEAPVPARGPAVMVEICDGEHFLQHGVGVIRHASRSMQPWILIVCDRASGEGHDLSRFATGVVPSEAAEGVRISTVTLSDEREFLDLIIESAFSPSLSIVVIREGDQPRYSVRAARRSMAEMDRLGYEPVEQVTRSVQEYALIRSPGIGHVVGGVTTDELPVLEGQVRLGRRGEKGPRTLRLSVCPLYEQIRVIRSRPPVTHGLRERASTLPVPQPIHAEESLWRVHLAGTRGRAPGLGAEALARVGRRMGYAVKWIFMPVPIGPGRNAWGQLVFTRGAPDNRTMPACSVRIPRGEAHLLLGLDVTETLRAVDPSGDLKVADASVTCAVVNTGRFYGERGGREDQRVVAQLEEHLATCVREECCSMLDYASLVRSQLHTDRLVDLVQLGYAFQAGLVPATPGAFQHVLESLEHEGYGRAVEAFRFGRSLQVQRAEGVQERGDIEETSERLLRRLRHRMQGGRRRRKTDQAFSMLLDETLQALALEEEAGVGPDVRRDFIAAMYRLHRWGSGESARAYARLLLDLKRSESPGNEHGLLSHVVLPLADAMLIRDSIYLSSMAISSEEMRRIRRGLVIRRARGDIVQYRYLTEINLSLGPRRLQVRFRTGNGPVRVLATLRRIIPGRLRGDRRSRALRQYVIGLVQRSMHRIDHPQAWYARVFGLLHQRACEDTLSEADPDVLRATLEDDDGAVQPASG